MPFRKLQVFLVIYSNSTHIVKMLISDGDIAAEDCHNKPNVGAISFAAEQVPTLFSHTSFFSI